MSEKVLGFGGSDHRAVILQAREGWSGPRPFRINADWFDDEDLLQHLKPWWESIKIKGNPGYIFSKELRALKNMIQNWTRRLPSKLLSQVLGIYQRRLSQGGE